MIIVNTSSMNNKSISFEYAQNFHDNEKEWKKSYNDLRLITIAFSKSVGVQMVLAEDYYRILDMLFSYSKGERGDFFKQEVDKIITKYEPTLIPLREKYKEQINE